LIFHFEKIFVTSFVDAQPGEMWEQKLGSSPDFKCYLKRPEHLPTFFLTAEIPQGW